MGATKVPQVMAVSLTVAAPHRQRIFEVGFVLSTGGIQSRTDQLPHGAFLDTKGSWFHIVWWPGG